MNSISFLAGVIYRSEGITGLRQLYWDPDDLFLVVPLVHQAEEGGEQEDEDEVEEEGEEEQPAGPQPVLVNESCQKRMRQNETCSLSGQIQQVLHQDQTPGVLVHQTLVVHRDSKVFIIDILTGGGDTGVQLLNDDLVSICDGGQQLVHQSSE